ncbi:MAG: hypothetical protein GC203_16525 [Phenylobacterium sp.]|uniref:hypothetical protein n=1 Tax=Phenylobacterium sp. TaxID=1871053 RepID=UPI0025D80A97|nr:hypothetical protein [Phenylobacterium sp.]MBI1199468.1 hypothetical protein [Phenylobacterium sp.]
MKLLHFATATAVAALLGGAAFAQQDQPVTSTGAPLPGSVTGDWNGAHAPPDDKQYTDTVKVQTGADAETATPPPAAASGLAVNPPLPSTPSVSEYSQPTATVTNLTVTNGPIPDTPENRAKYGGPRSHAGKMTKPAGN